MYFRLFTSSSRSAVRFSRNVNIVIKTSRRRLYYDPGALKDSPRNVASEKFPGYNVIYQLNTVQYISTFNRLKYHYTLFITGAIPVASCLWLFNAISQETYAPLICFASILTIMIHITGLLCNNVVGFIYLNEDQKSMKLSYVNYWGKRKDVDLQPINIIPLSKTNIRNNKMYNTLKLSIIKKPLKLYIKDGEILDEECFSNIFGSVKM